MRLLATLAFLSIVLAPTAAVAGQINSDAPDVATGTFAVPPRIYQIEQNIQANFASGVTSFNFPSLHRFGLIDNLELRLESPLANVTTAGGVSRSDVALAVKWNMAVLGLPDWMPPLALLGTGNVDPTNAITPSLNLLTDIELPLDIGLNANLGGTMPGGAAAVTYALSFSRDIMGPLQAYAEVAGQYDPAGLASANGVDGGLMYFLDDDTKIMAAVQTDIAKPFDSWYITTNYSHRFGTY